MKTHHTAKQLPMPRWWVRTRPSRLDTQINAGQWLPPCVEFYVPLWAWPLELLHRFCFGARHIKALVACVACLSCLPSCSVYEKDQGGYYIGNMINGSPILRLHRNHL